MHKMKNVLLITMLLLCFTSAYSQWVRVDEVPAEEIEALAINNGSIYAASFSNKIYTSDDNGDTWDTLTVDNKSINITSLSFFNGSIYAGTFRAGVYFSSDNGSTWQTESSSPAAVSGFAVKDNVLYASTLGNGTAVLDTVTGSWSPLNDSLPDYSVNVQRIIASPDFLIIAAGANGTFYKYDFANGYWAEGFYYGFLRPGLLIDNLLNIGDTIYAVNGRRIIRSSDAGESWSDDNDGTHNGTYRNVYSGLNSLYTLTNILPEGTWIQKRSKDAAAGTSWTEKEEFLPDGFAYDIIESGDRIFLARGDGLYLKKTITGTKDNGKAGSGPAGYSLNQNYPNPFNPATIIEYNTTGNTFVSLKVYDVLGRQVAVLVNEYKPAGNYKAAFNGEGLSSGIYYYKLESGTGSLVKKMVLSK